MKNKTKDVIISELQKDNAALLSSLEKMKAAFAEEEKAHYVKRNDLIKENRSLLSGLCFFTDTIGLSSIIQKIPLDQKKDLLLHLVLTYNANGPEDLIKSFSDENFSSRRVFIRDLLDSITNEEYVIRYDIIQATIERDNIEKKILLNDIYYFLSLRCHKRKSFEAKFNDYLFSTYKTKLLESLTFNELLSLKEKFFKNK